MTPATDCPSHNARKKRRHCDGADDEGPPADDVNTTKGLKEEKKKKKKKKVVEEQEASPPPSAVTGKRSRTEENPQPESGESTKKKKKKKKAREEREASPLPLAVTGKRSSKEENPQLESGESAKKKKKRKRKEEGEEKHLDVMPPKEETGKQKKKKKKRDIIRKKRKEEIGGGEEARGIEEEDDRGIEEEEERGGVGDISEKVLEELEEFVPNVRKKSQEEINKLLRYDLERFRRFKEQGMSARTGRHTEEENKRIIRNVADFLALTGIESANQLLFPDRYKDRGAAIKKLKAQHRFLVKIAEGIPRTCQQVYNRAVKLFDETNHLGRFSEEELRSLVKLQNLHGNDWKEISQKMGRSALSLEKRFGQLAARHGAWSAEETSKLTQAVKARMEVLVQQSAGGSAVSREQLCNNLPWKEISFHVATRSWSQCRLKWFSILKTKMSSHRPSTSSRTVDRLQFRIRLINTLYNLQVDDQADVDWDGVAGSIGDVTPMCVQKGFHRLKISKVSNWSRMLFGDIIDYLQRSVVPSLKEKLRQKMSVEAQPEAEQSNLSYLLSDIFSSEDEDDFREVDNS